MRVLHLTTPHETGADVKSAQQLLAKNQFGSFYDGPIDGDFGPETAHACYLAKYWIGYSTGSCKPIIGVTLENYLTGKKPLGPLMKVRRAARLKVQKQIPLSEKAYNVALTQLGVAESPPNSNNVLYSRWYGFLGAWCAMYVSWCYVHAGSNSFQAGSRYAYVPYIVDDARAGRNGLALTSSPRKGDIVCYDWNRDGQADHTGLFEAWIDSNTFTAIEGNTAIGNDSNGGQVMRRQRVRSNVQAFVRVEK